MTAKFFAVRKFGCLGEGPLFVVLAFLSEFVSQEDAEVLL